TAAHTSLAFTGKPDTSPVLYAGRDVNRKRTLARNPPAAAANLARIVDDLPATVAGRTGTLECEKALCMPNFAGTTARRAGFRFRSGLGAASRARLASHRGWNADLRGFPGKSLLKAYFHVVAQVGSAFPPGSASPRGRHAEDTLKNVGERRSKIG